MNNQTTEPAKARDLADESEAPSSLSYRISAQPVIDRTSSGEEISANDLPRSYGTQTLTLMARDPRTLFAYWDIDWKKAFGAEPAAHQPVFLKLQNEKGQELGCIEIEPMAGNCYITVTDAEATYRGELGYNSADKTWNKLATSDVVTTPSDVIGATSEADFATVPFHLSFQHMIDRLRVSQQENESLVSMLTELRKRAADKDEQSKLDQSQRELAQAMEAAASSSSLPSRSDFWNKPRIERILGLGGSSPAGGFGGNSSR